MVKRLFDFSVSFMALALLSPLMIAIAFVILIQMGFPVFFAQQRPGKGGTLFTLYKFRTMTVVPNSSAASLSDEARLTDLGVFLRRTSLDELPELWNVIRGEMSLVGPRPLLVEYLPLYTAEQARRHNVRPGITGWAQINGRNAISWNEKFSLDIWYVEHQTIRLDIRILLLTVLRVLRRRDISAPGHSTMPKFEGGSGCE